MAETGRPVLKLILVGEYGVGKSSLFRRFVNDTFCDSKDSRSTIGFDHSQKTYKVEGRTVILQLWDTGGLERVASVTSSYFKHADGALLVFAHDAMDSFNALSQSAIEVVANSEHARLFLCGNKSDLRARGMGPTNDDVLAFYRENQISEDENLFKRLYAVSCKTGEQVHRMFADVVAHLARDIRPSDSGKPTIQLESNREPQLNKTCCPD